MAIKKTDITVRLSGLCESQLPGQKSQLKIVLFNLYLVVTQPTLGHYHWGSPTNPMLIPSFLQFQPKGHGEPLNHAWSLSLA